MERDFDKDEIVSALKDMEGDKAPRPDGFIVAFFKSVGKWRSMM